MSATGGRAGMRGRRGREGPREKRRGEGEQKEERMMVGRDKKMENGQKSSNWAETLSIDIVLHGESF